jgi:hypothetical protein
VNERIRSGRYLYERNGESVDIIEEFDIIGDGCVLPLRADSALVRSSRTTSTGVSIGVVSDATRVEVVFTSEDNTVSSVFTQNGVNMVCARTVNGAETPTTSHPFPTVVSPILRVYQGPAIAELARQHRASSDVSGQPEPATVLIPWIYDPANTGLLLTANIEHRRAWTELDGTFRYVGGNYDDAAVFELASDDTLTSYVWSQSPDTIWTVRIAPKGGDAGGESGNIPR